jgi:VIT1/CCC1 family predicted Fe2+/Mn2+ transporter
VRVVPALERDEVRALFERKGFRGELLERVVATITADPDVWVGVMLSEEHGLAPVDRGRALRSALVVGVAALVGSLLPLAPFLVLPVRRGIAVAAATAAVVLFALGAYKARVTTGRPIRNGFVMAAIGIVSALAGYAAGVAFRVPSLCS